MDTFICWDGDKIGRRVGRAVLADDVGAVRRVDQAINAGNELWRAFALNNGGSVIEIGGDEGRIVVDASKLADMPQVAKQYADLVGATVSVGVGMKLSESAKALVVAKLRGGNVILVWDPEAMAAEYDQAVNAPKTEQQKISDEYLKKGDGPDTPQPQSAGGQDIALITEHNEKKNAGPNAGFAVQHDPGFTTVKPGDAPAGAEPPAQMPGAAPPAQPGDQGPNFEDQLHSAAQGQSDQDDQDAQTDQDGAEDAKKAVSKALVNIRKQLPDIAKLRQFAPEAYKAIIGLVQGVVVLGKQVMGDGDQGPMVDDELPKEAVQKSEESKEESTEKADLPTTPPEHGEMGLSEKPSTAGVPEHHKDLPVGSVLDGKVKVRHDDGAQTWKQVESGMVQGQNAEPPLFGANSHPVSSREATAG